MAKTTHRRRSTRKTSRRPRAASRRRSRPGSEGSRSELNRPGEEEFSRPSEEGEEVNRPSAIQPTDSEDEAGAYARGRGGVDTGESDAGVTQRAPHFREP